MRSRLMGEPLELLELGMGFRWFPSRRGFRRHAGFRLSLPSTTVEVEEIRRSRKWKEGFWS